MATLAFDTLAFTKKVRTAFTPDQAEVLAEAFVAGATEQLATKADLRDLELRLDTRFAQADTHMAQIETRIAETANRMILWTVGTIIACTALAVTLGKLIP